MPPYFTYLAEVSLCMFVLFVFYLLFLKRLTFYRTRRFFLIFSLLASFLIPSLDIKVQRFPAAASSIGSSLKVTPTPINRLKPVYQQKNIEKLQPLTASEKFKPNPDLKNLLLLIYLLGVIFLSTKLFLGFFRLLKQIKSSKPETLNGIAIYPQQSEIPAFSFLKYVFINPQLLNDEKEADLIVRHEMVHVTEKHFYDLLLFEIAKVILWFNPIIYLIKNEAEKIHEFLADKKSSKIAGKNPYSQMLLRHAQSRANIAMVHSFAALPLKFRIKELFKKESSKISRLNLVLAFPVLTTLILVFSCSQELDTSELMLSNGKQIKSIKVLYHDEYGDMPQYDGKYYSWAKFNKSGELTEFKKGTSTQIENISFNTENNIPTDAEEIMWDLDYNSYPVPPSLILNPNNFAKKKMKEALNIQRFTSDFTIKKYASDLPLEISTTFPMDFENELNTRKFTNRDIFQYDNENRMLKCTTYNNVKLPNGKNDERATSRAVEYNLIGKVSKVTADEIVLDIFYTEQGKISEVSIGGITFTFQYNDLGLRTKSFAYNPNGELEYTLDYEYDFF